MKKAVLKFFLKLFVLLTVSLVVFVLGYVQFYVPLGKCGVFLSKTSGYHKDIITHEGFLWKWEALIPTNSKILLFSLSPITIETKKEGKLEKASNYAMFLKNEPNFSWKVEVAAQFEIKKDELIAYLRKTNAKNEDEFLQDLKERIENVIGQQIEDCILFYQESEKCNKFLFNKRLKSNIEANIPKVLTCHISTIEIALPDFHAYRSARSVAQEYARTKQDILIAKIEKLKTVQNNIETLSKDIEKSILELEKVLNDESPKDANSKDVAEEEKSLGYYAK